MCSLRLTQVVLLAMQLDVALDIVGHADKPDIALACLACLKRHGILVLDGSMDCPLPLPYGNSHASKLFQSIPAFVQQCLLPDLCTSVHVCLDG